jgi:sulfite reductase (NADPH) flavoprotein alpha-component
MAHTAQKYNKENPFLTDLLVNIKLNKEGSQKDTRHFEIKLKEDEINYLPGDALYVCPENDPNLVKELLSLITLEHSQEAEFTRCTKEINITRASNKLFKLIEDKSSGAHKAAELTEKFNGYNLVNIIKSFSDIQFTSNEIAENSSKLQARAYSIASSMRAHPNQVDLCIARVDEEINGQKILGVCSNYLSNRVDLNSTNLRVYVHVNEKFRLPADKKTNIIMVGPGTGIAPFRAFIEERNCDRDAGEQVGKDWLFFGDQRAAYDYLYQEELESYKSKYGLEITTAFSRDQAEKVYVQNRMKENSKQIFDWLENGAHFYVCGDARRMAKDVDLALHEIIRENGKDAEAYIKNLKETNRYSRDVY